MKRYVALVLLTIAGFVVPGHLVSGCSGTDRSAASGGATTHEVAKSEVTSAGLEPNRDSTRASWRVVDDGLAGEWKTVPVSVEADLDTAIVPIDDNRLAVVRTTNGGKDIAAYIFDSTTEVATPAAPSGAGWRTRLAAVWTGEKILIVGGASAVTIGEPTLLGYDPDRDDWDEDALDPLPTGNALWGKGAWTGSEILFGSSGLALDPERGTWRTIAKFPLAERVAATEIWTGHELIVWGGCDASMEQCDDFGQGLFTDGAIYEPSSDTWREMAPGPLPPGASPAAVWTGNEVIYYPGLGDEAVASAASYNPARDQWAALPAPPLSPRRGLGLAFSRDAGLLFAWGGSDPSGNPLNDGAALDVSTMRWLLLPAAPSRTARDRHAMEAIAETLYVDGGWPAGGPLILRPN